MTYIPANTVSLGKNRGTLFPMLCSQTRVCSVNPGAGNPGAGNPGAGNPGAGNRNR